MSDQLITGTPPASPDSLRMFQQLLKQYYDQHISRSVGYQNIDGLPFVGTFENFGSEMLYETRKLRILRPPLDWIPINSVFSQYFNLQYADFINTFEQQNLVMGCVKANSMIGHVFKLKFTDVTEVKIVRARSDQRAEDVETVSSVDTFAKTYTAPVLMIDDQEYPLYAIDETNMQQDVTYYFALNHMTTDLIESYDDGTLITCDMSTFTDIPFVWFTLKQFATYPMFELSTATNIDQNGNPLLVIGTNEQHQNCMYPLIYGADNLPASAAVGVESKWYLKVQGDFSDDESHIDLNMTSMVSGISYVELNPDDLYTQSPYTSHDVGFYGDYVKITLDKSYQTQCIFHRPQPGDYDYDDVTHINRTYALIPIEVFNQNIPDGDTKQILRQAFHVIFDEAYLNAFEKSINHMRAGLHLDYTTDYSKHSVDKKFGVVYGLSDFGGLPPYYSTYLDKNIHHAHAELYAIRDDANTLNQRPIDKQTAAIILESGIPDNEMKEITASMQPVIIYDNDYDHSELPHQHRYITDESAIISSVNFLSNIGYYNNRTFIDTTVEGYSSLQKFVFHGNRTFSMGIIEFDPEYEFGRGYLITNDGTQYENNASVEHPKAERTAARICDIPTSFDQLENITGVSPTIVIDESYIRQRAAYKNDDLNQIWNVLSSKRYLYNNGPQIPTRDQLPIDIGMTNAVIVRPIQYLLWTDRDTTFTIAISTPGSGYEIGDTFGFNIGGIFFRGTVDDVDGSNGITDFTLNMDPKYPGDNPIAIPILNFDNRVSIFNLSTTSGSGSGAVITWTIMEGIWAARVNMPDVPTRHDGVYTFYRDSEHEGVFAIPYQDGLGWDEDRAVQISGDLNLGEVVYDVRPDVRQLKQVYLFNSFRYWKTNCGNLTTDIYEATYTKKTSSTTIPFSSEDIELEQLKHGDDIHEQVSNKGLNTWDCFVTVLPEVGERPYNYKAFAWEREYSPEYTWFRDGLMNSMLFPKRSNLNFSLYSGNWTGIKMSHMVTSSPIPTVFDVQHKTIDEYQITNALISLRLREPFIIDDVAEYNPDLTCNYLYNRGLMNYNLYRMDHMISYRVILEKRAELLTYDRSTIYNMIISKFGIDPTRIQSLTTEAMIDYYIQNSYQAYDIPELTLFKKVGDSTDFDSDVSIGAFVPLRHPDEQPAYINNIQSSKQMQKLYTIRIDTNDALDLSTFKMYDKNHNNISEQTLLILNRHAYIYDNDAPTKWVRR